MIGTVLEELRRDAEAGLPAAIAAVAAQRRVPLDAGFTVYDWWHAESEKLKLAFPALSIQWDGTRTGLDILRLVAAEVREGGTHYYGVVTADDVLRLLQSTERAGLPLAISR